MEQGTKLMLALDVVGALLFILTAYVGLVIENGMMLALGIVFAAILSHSAFLIVRSAVRPSSPQNEVGEKK
jgi:hypothetical protein